jgi:hypothetical protein
MNDKCPICGNQAEFKPTTIDGSIVNCLRCGNFTITGTLESIIRNSRKLEEKDIVLLSGYIRENQNITLNSENYKTIISSTRMPKPNKKADKALLAFEELTKIPGDLINTSKNDPEYLMVIGKSYISNFNEWKYIVYELLGSDKGYIKIFSINLIQITSAGWEYLEELTSTKEDNINNQKTYNKGEIFDPYVDIIKIIKQATQSITLIDNYIDDTVLTMLSKNSKNVRIRIFTKNISTHLQLDIQRFEQQYGKIHVEKYNDSHDRYLIIDDKEVYHFGASIKDLGTTGFTYSKLEHENAKKLIISLPDLDTKQVQD